MNLLTSRIAKSHPIEPSEAYFGRSLTRGSSSINMTGRPVGFSRTTTLGDEVSGELAKSGMSNDDELVTLRGELLRLLIAFFSDIISSSKMQRFCNTIAKVLKNRLPRPEHLHSPTRWKRYGVEDLGKGGLLKTP